MWKLDRKRRIVRLKVSGETCGMKNDCSSSFSVISAGRFRPQIWRLFIFSRKTPQKFHSDSDSLVGPHTFQMLNIATDVKANLYFSMRRFGRRAPIKGECVYSGDLSGMCLDDATSCGVCVTVCGVRLLSLVTVAKPPTQVSKCSARSLCICTVGPLKDWKPARGPGRV